MAEFRRAVKWGCGLYLGVAAAGLAVTGLALFLGCAGFLGVGAIKVNPSGKALAAPTRPASAR